MVQDILLDENDDINLLNGDFDIGESEMQEVGIILRLRQGELKSDPVLGANLQHFMKGKYDRIAIEKRLKLHLGRDGKNYDEIKKKIEERINGRTV